MPYFLKIQPDIHLPVPSRPTSRVVSWFSSQGSRTQRAPNIGSAPLADFAETCGSEVLAPLSGSDAPSGSGGGDSYTAGTRSGAGPFAGAGTPHLAGGGGAPRIGSSVGGLPKGRGDPILEEVRG